MCMELRAIYRPYNTIGIENETKQSSNVVLVLKKHTVDRIDLYRAVRFSVWQQKCKEKKKLLNSDFCIIYFLAYDLYQSRSAMCPKSIWLLNIRIQCRTLFIWISWYLQLDTICVFVCLWLCASLCCRNAGVKSVNPIHRESFEERKKCTLIPKCAASSCSKTEQ